MAKTDKRIDAYIEKAKPFAQPILKHLRELVHEGCPGVEETVKWGMPSFEYKGPFFSMAAFKQHAVFGFMKSELINDPKGYLQERKAHGGEAMGHGGRIESMKDLPPDRVMLDFIKQAKRLNDEGIKVTKKPAAPKKDLEVPDYFMAAIAKNKDALRTFEAFSTSNKREYVDWITEAKSEATREKRMETAVEWIAEGKIRNWKYMRK
jgi:uncharacterized protein YdeI (YjbR/CyaY-like superfamily)